MGQRREIAGEELAELLNVSLADANELIAQATHEVQQLGYPYPWKTR